jgi:hypothetical protein
VREKLPHGIYIDLREPDTLFTEPNEKMLRRPRKLLNARLGQPGLAQVRQKFSDQWPVLFAGQTSTL